MVREGRGFLANLLMIVSEVVRILIRPVTLTCRVCVNVTVGKIVLSLLRIVASKFFQPCLWGVIRVSVIFSVFIRFITFLRCIFLRVAEALMGAIQTFVFVGLLIFYVYEVPVKVVSVMKDKRSLVK